MATPAERSSIVILITNDGMGKAEKPLQHKLIQTYLGLLNENDALPSTICFDTDGVKLAVEGSSVIDVLKSLEEKGVSQLLCLTGNVILSGLPLPINVSLHTISHYQCQPIFKVLSPIKFHPDNNPPCPISISELAVYLDQHPSL